MMKMKNLKILLSTILIGAAFIGCSSTPDEKTVKSLAALYNIKSAQDIIPQNVKTTFSKSLFS